MKCLIKDYFNSLYTNETNLYGSCRRGLYTMNWERLYHCELYGVDSIWNEIWDEEVYPIVSGQWKNKYRLGNL